MKKILWLCGIIASLSVAAAAQGGLVSGITLDNRQTYSKVMSGAKVQAYVCTTDPCPTLPGSLPAVPLYTNKALSVLQPQTTYVLSDDNGNYFFWVPSATYLICVSGTSFATQCQPALVAPSAGGSGTVVNFAAGNLDPLFTTTVVNPTTNPVLSFVPELAPAHTFYGNNTSSPALPAFYTVSGGGSGCTPPGFDTAVISEHPLGTCYGNADFTWDDTNYFGAWGFGNGISGYGSKQFMIGTGIGFNQTASTLSPVFHDIYAFGDGAGVTNADDSTTHDVIVLGDGPGIETAGHNANIIGAILIGDGGAFNASGLPAPNGTPTTIQNAYMLGDGSITPSAGAQVTDAYLLGSNTASPSGTSNSLDGIFGVGYNDFNATDNSSHSDMFGLGVNELYNCNECVAVGEVQVTDNYKIGLGISSHNDFIPSMQITTGNVQRTPTGMSTHQIDHARTSGSATVTGTVGQTCVVNITGGALGVASLNGTNSLPSGSNISITTTAYYASAPTTATLSNGSATCSGSINLQTVIMRDSIPACTGTTEGSWAAIVDSSTNTIGATISGGGSFHVLGYCDGSNWTVSGGAVTGGGGGGVTAINSNAGAFTFTGGGVSCTGTTRTFGGGGGLAFPATVSGTVNSGGIPYFNTTTGMSSTLTLSQYGFVYGGGAGTAPATLAGNTNADDRVVVSHGTGSATAVPFLSNAPALSALNMTNLQASALSGTVSIAHGGTGTTSPALVAGTNVSITGSWPNQTINATGGGGGGVSSINSNAGAFNFTGGGVSCVGTTCTFSGGGGSVTSVTGTAPVSSSGGATPNISIATHGSGSTVQTSDGSGTVGNCPQYNASGALTDSGQPCNSINASHAMYNVGLYTISGASPYVVTVPTTFLITSSSFCAQFPANSTAQAYTGVLNTTGTNSITFTYTGSTGGLVWFACSQN